MLEWLLHVELKIYSLHSFLHVKSAGLGLQLMFDEHIEVLRPSGRNPGSQLYSICDPTTALTNSTIKPFTGGAGSPQPAEDKIVCHYTFCLLHLVSSLF